MVLRVRPHLVCARLQPSAESVHITSERILLRNRRASRRCLPCARPTPHLGAAGLEAGGECGHVALRRRRRAAAAAAAAPQAHGLPLWARLELEEEFSTGVYGICFVAVRLQGPWPRCVCPADLRCLYAHEYGPRCASKNSIETYCIVKAFFQPSRQGDARCAQARRPTGQHAASAGATCAPAQQLNDPFS